MKLKPLHDRIVVEAAAKEEVSAGGIILPDGAQEKPQRGTVLAVGPGKTLDSGKIAPVDVRVGDIVLYGKYGGTEVTVGLKDFTILRADDVLAVVSGIQAPRKAPTGKATVPKKSTSKKSAKPTAKNAAKPTAKRAAPKAASKKSPAKKASKPSAKKSAMKAVKKAAPKPTAKKKTASKR